jgi:hypothetical protein
VSDEPYIKEILSALAQRGDIRPDEATQAAIAWKGEPWRPPEEAKPDEKSKGTSEEDGPEADEPDVRFSLLTDAPCEDEDRLGRGPYALFLARRLNHIWHNLNPPGPARISGPSQRPGARESNTFILHVDAPWGGGKTTFAHFVARVLQPTNEAIGEHHFLYSSLGARPSASLADLLGPPPGATADGSSGPALQPWIVARYNAWRDQYVQPPWWQIFCSIESAVDEELVRNENWEARARIWWKVQLYKLGNSKLRGQMTMWAIFGILLLLLWATGVLGTLWTQTSGNPESIGKIVGAAVAILGFGGVGIATLFTLIGQSLNPDLDFTAESKQIGVGDPISRFRAMFEQTLQLAGRPVLLIVDDIDRCDPRAVVEVMRGFQTVVRSSRLFVLLLGDREWIEAAHDNYHESMKGIADPESSLGAQFVRKVIQLSFRLPVMSDAARNDYTRYILSSSEARRAEPKVNEILQKLEQRLERSDLSNISVAQREMKIEEAASEARDQLKEHGQQSDTKLLDQIVAIKQVVAASQDSEREAKLTSALADLFSSLPSNPRQMKRIVMAFGIYENVGRLYYQYRQTQTGEDGEEKARRWRQLAIWVTLATEWPATWRELARRPNLLSGAFAGPERRAEVLSALNRLPQAEGDRLKAVIERLQADPPLSTLLNQAKGDSALEETAIYEFNRIIWEPGFKLYPDNPPAD